MREIADRLELLFRASGAASHAELAKKLGLKRGTWSSYVTGERDLPFSVMRDLKKLFGCSVDWLVLGEEVHNSPAFQAKLDIVRHAPKPPRGRPRKR